MRWKIHGRRQLYASEWVNVWLEDVELPDGQRLEHHVLRMPRQSVTVVAVDDAERVLMLWRHRFITDSWGWEIPAGWLDADESPEEAAQREVLEETGWRPGPLHRLCEYYALPGISDQRFTLFRADGATYEGRPSDGSEASRVEWIPTSNIRKLMSEGLITDGPSVTALSFAIAFVLGEP
jgi:8-oxo-dGTP pyrophosphatase MutT (NUDIX family)